MTPAVEAATAKELTVAEGRELFDETARRLLSMSGLDFLAAYEAGKFKGREEEPEVHALIMLIPFTTEQAA